MIIPMEDRLPSRIMEFWIPRTSVSATAVCRSNSGVVTKRASLKALDICGSLSTGPSARTSSMGSPAGSSWIPGRDSKGPSTRRCSRPRTPLRESARPSTYSASSRPERAPRVVRPSRPMIYLIVWLNTRRVLSRSTRLHSGCAARSPPATRRLSPGCGLPHGCCCPGERGFALDAAADPGRMGLPIGCAPRHVCSEAE